LRERVDRQDLDAREVVEHRLEQREHSRRACGAVAPIAPEGSWNSSLTM
jgi:hypothetical protein